MSKAASKTTKNSKKKAPASLTPEVLDAADWEEKESAEAEEAELDPEAIQFLPVLDESEIAEAAEPTDEPPLLPIPKDGALSVSQIDLLKQYLKEISKYPLLKPDEEYKLAMELKNSGDRDVARALVTANLRLVVKIAMEYRNAYQNVMDLIQEGNVGLMKAVSKYDPTKGAKLSYYASWWIRSYILKYILDNFRLIKVGTTQAQKKLFFHLMREKERLEAQGILAGPKLLADKLHVKESEVLEMEQRLGSRGAEMSLNTTIRDGDNDSPSHMDNLVDKTQAVDISLENEQLQNILKNNIQDFSKLLKEKELAVFQERMLSEEPKTLQEVANLFGLTRERARQLETQVIQKLRKYFMDLIAAPPKNR